ncbi:MAG: HAMP domain-containing protein, partial [Oligoflexia bacterium]|nr:HAMP domain-containing protein [Oligoflexia bacterium]
RNIAKVTTAVAKGDLSQKITVDAKGEISELKNTINTMVDQLNSFAAEVTRVAKEVGTEGKLGGQADVKGVSGTWKDLTDNVNFMALNLTKQVRGIIKVVTAVANGDLNQKFVLEAKGEVAALAETINSMTDTLRTFADQVTTVAREVGVEGKLGGQARVPGASGTWKDLTDNVNFMASNLTKQVRGIIKVITAVADGDLSQKFVLEAKGEVAALAETINSMTDTLRTFAAQVTGVAREVGVEGILGGQAKVPGASGTWKDLTDNVNQLAGNLTTQVRAIAEVSTAVTKGDLTRSITVEAEGEVAALKNNINQMIGNLKETTQKNQEQDWLKTNLAMFSGMMQGQRSITSVAQLIMSELTPLIKAQHGTFFMNESEEDGETSLVLSASYAYSERKNVGGKYRLKEGLVGQCAFEKKKILLSQVPSDYVQVSSSLGEAKPHNIIVLPVLFEGELKAVIELASLEAFTPNYLNFLDQLMDSIGVILNMIASSMRTEELLQELKKSNAELEAQAEELEEKAKLLELKNQEVELASRSLEEKAEQLSLISKYKSEFLANMSHELRTPLNSLLILSKMLAENKDKNLTADQVKYASTVYSAGRDLLALINEILDLSKVEAGKMPIDPRDVFMGDIQEHLEQTFRPVAEHKGLQFNFHIGDSVPKKMFTDVNRLHQILKNLLSNAYKFTEHGSVDLKIGIAEKSLQLGIDSLSRAGRVIAFSVTDTGIGIPMEKQKLIFEAFQQADGTTSRKYGGTGLGLTISREIARLLGGVIHVESIPGKGSTFTLYLPQNYTGGDMTAPLDTRELEVVIPLLPKNADFTGRKILIMDDDVRNIFAITTILESQGVIVSFAENGKKGIDLLKKDPSVELILMDMMMPEMDGLQATAAIRNIEQFKELPILALTAKAMKGDREKCIEAGASDYITKPVDPEKLLAMIHMWIMKSETASLT